MFLLSVSRLDSTTLISAPSETLPLDGEEKIVKWNISEKGSCGEKIIQHRHYHHQHHHHAKITKCRLCRVTTNRERQVGPVLEKDARSWWADLDILGCTTSAILVSIISIHPELHYTALIMNIKSINSLTVKY